MLLKHVKVLLEIKQTRAIDLLPVFHVFTEATIVNSINAKTAIKALCNNFSLPYCVIHICHRDEPQGVEMMVVTLKHAIVNQYKDFHFVRQGFARRQDIFGINHHSDSNGYFS